MSLLIKNGLIFDVKKGFFIENDILISDGKILKIDKGISYGKVDKVINADNKNIFPGFIDAHTHIGMWTYTANGNDANECVHPMTPLMRAIDGANPKDKCFPEAISAGFTTVMITPGSGNVIGGQAAIIKTYGNTMPEMTENSYAALKIAFGENPKNVYGLLGKSPSSRMSTSALLEEEFTKAILYKEKSDKGNIDKSLYWETYIPVINREIPLKIHAHRADDILSAIRIAERFDFKYTLDHCTEGLLIVDELANRDVPILIGPPMMFKTKQETRNSSIETAKILSEKGCNVSVISDHPFANGTYLAVYVGLMVKEGLDYAKAISMLTINPAKALGIDHKVGSIEEGKDADIVIFDGDPLEMRTNVNTTIIKGEIVYQS